MVSATTGALLPLTIQRYRGVDDGPETFTAEKSETLAFAGLTYGPTRRNFTACRRFLHRISVHEDINAKRTTHCASKSSN